MIRNDNYSILVLKLICSVPDLLKVDSVHVLISFRLSTSSKESIINESSCKCTNNDNALNWLFDNPCKSDELVSFFYC